MSAPPPDVSKEMTTTVTDLVDLRTRLTAWLAARTGSAVEIGELSRPAASGMSSITILFDATWSEDGQEIHAELVARMPPAADAFPVFPSYDLRRQYDVIAAVAEHSDTPLPKLYWIEESPDALGGPFIVMQRLAGEIPTDNPPYVFGGWLLDAGEANQNRLMETSLQTLAQIHAITDVRSRFGSLAAETAPDALRSMVDGQREYYEWTSREDGLRIPIIDETFAWLEAHWPADQGETVLSWGDSRPGNMIYRDFAPVAVLDWEMAALGPREVDVAWMIFLHRFFQDLAEVFELPGIPFFQRADVVRIYEAASAHTIRDLEWYIVYAGLRYAIVMSQVKRRMIHFGEDSEPETLDEYVMFHAMLREVIEGTYDWTGK
jgi:aminoglycoside phosphotransferase (APT) family kinase protein